jgi:hypothetical protein
MKGLYAMATNINRYEVTLEMIAKCSRVVDLNVRPAQVFYLVESAHTADEYKVIFDRKHRVLTCDCKAGRQGVCCWHRRAAVAAAAAFKAEVAARIQETEKTLREVESDDREITLEATYTVAVDETSSSLDGIYFERCPASGNMVPMR